MNNEKLQEVTMLALQGKLTESVNDKQDLLNRIVFIKKLLNGSTNLSNYDNMTKSQIRAILKKYCTELLNTGFKGYVLNITYSRNDRYNCLYAINEKELGRLYDAKIFNNVIEAENFYTNMNIPEDINIIGHDVMFLNKIISRW